MIRLFRKSKQQLQIDIRKIIMGLGNPGTQYQNNRHNFGFMVVDSYARSKGLGFRSGGKAYLWAEDIIQTPQGNQAICLCKPLTYMNNSGAAARQVLEQYQLDIRDLLVIYDDVDLPLGRIRLRKKGSPGGHNGIKSISNHLKSLDFPRLRLGIGPQDDDVASEDFVLDDFRKTDLTTVDRVLNTSMKLIHDYLENDIDSVMTKYNRNDLGKATTGEA